MLSPSFSLFSFPSLSPLITVIISSPLFIFSTLNFTHCISTYKIEQINAHNEQQLHHTHHQLQHQNQLHNSPAQKEQITNMTLTQFHSLDAVLGHQMNCISLIFSFLLRALSLSRHRQLYHLSLLLSIPITQLFILFFIPVAVS